MSDEENKETGMVKKKESAPELIMGMDMVKNASVISTELRNIIEKQELYAVIQGKKFITVEGWNTLGAMLGVFPEVVRTKDLSGVRTKENPNGTETKFNEIKYWAEVQIKKASGEVISSAQAICSSKEKGRTNVDEYVILSMAQTRATGKAFRLAFSWLVKMAGYEPTPSEEVHKKVTASVKEPETPKV